VFAAATIAARYDQDPATVSSALNIRSQYFQRSVSLINEKLTIARRSPSYEMVMAVVNLMAHKVCKDATQTSETEIRSPLANAHSLLFFGASQLVADDMKFLGQLIEMRGGIDTIDTVPGRYAIGL
jgi:hypothetical protein